MRGRTFALVATVLLAACGGTADEASPTTTAAAPPTTAVPSTTTTIAPTTTLVDEEAAVIEAYLGYWEAYFTVTNPGQPDHPIIDRYATGDAAARLRQAANDRLAANEAFRYPEGSVASHSVTVEDLSEDRALARDCFVDDSYRVDLLTGQTADGEVETNLLVTTLRRVDGGWRVSDVPTLLRQWEGLGTCEA